MILRLGRGSGEKGRLRKKINYDMEIEYEKRSIPIRIVLPNKYRINVGFRLTGNSEYRVWTSGI